MRAFSRSYGLISIFTMSPAAILMKFLRSLPEICASTTCPFESCTLNIVPGRTATTRPSTSIALLSADMVNAGLAQEAEHHGFSRQKDLVRQKRARLVKVSRHRDGQSGMPVESRSPPRRPGNRIRPRTDSERYHVGYGKISLGLPGA